MAGILGQWYDVIVVLQPTCDSKQIEVDAESDNNTVYYIGMYYCMHYIGYYYYQ